MAPALTIGQLAHATGVSAKAIRYYEQVGVLPSPSRSAAGYRQYTQRSVQRLLFMRRARALGLPLRHLKALAIALDAGPRARMRPRLLVLVRAQRSAVQRQLAELQLLERQLDHVLRRLQRPVRADHAQGCRCLEIADNGAGAGVSGAPRDRPEPGREAAAGRARPRSVGPPGRTNPRVPGRGNRH